LGSIVTFHEKLKTVKLDNISADDYKLLYWNQELFDDVWPVNVELPKIPIHSFSRSLWNLGINGINLSIF
jgi:hypothetical protein